MSTTAIGTILDDLVADWSALSALVGVNVFSGPVPVGEESGLECIVIGQASLDESPAAMGGTRLEEWHVDGEMYIAATWQSTTEATIKAARDRALELFAAVETYINDTYTGALPDVEITAGTLTPAFTSEARTCWLSFTLRIRATKNP